MHTHTEKFLDVLLGGHLEPAHWRVIHDRDENARAENIKEMPLTDDVVRHFTGKQGGHRSPFIVVNDGGHRDQDITSVRACFVDADGVLEPEKWRVQPNMIVRRDASHWHAYWMIDDGEPMRLFQETQRALAGYYGTDSAVCNLSRVMRLPGFYHHKGKPTMITTEVVNDVNRHALQDLLDMHPHQEAPIHVTPMSGERIGKGGRHQAFVSAAAGMRNLGFFPGEILCALKELRNTRTEDPETLGDEELNRIAKFAGTQAALVNLSDVSEGAQIASRIQESHKQAMAERASELSTHARFDPGPLPQALLRPPGTLWDMMEYIMSQSRMPQPAYALGTAMSVMSCVLAGRVRGTMGAHTSLLNFCVGPTGSGKQAPMECGRKILTYANAGPKIIGDFASDTAITRYLDYTPDAMVISDEIGQKMMQISADKTGPLVGVIKTFLELFSSAGREYFGKIYADPKNNINIPWTCFNLLGYTVPEAFHQSLDSSSISSGFLPRCLIFRAEGRTEEREFEMAPPSEQLIAEVESWTRLPQFEDNRLVIAPDMEGLHVLRQFSKECRVWEDREEDERLKNLWTRCAEKAERMAICVACARVGGIDMDRAHPPRINADDASYACTLSLHITRQMICDFYLSIADNVTEKIVKEILKRVQKAGRDGLQHTTLVRQTFKLTKYERTNAIESLTESGTILKGQPHRKERQRGKPAVFYWTPENYPFDPRGYHADEENPHEAASSTGKDDK